MEHQPMELYKILQTAYGPQGWWPMPSCAGLPGYDLIGYHRDGAWLPGSPLGRCEIFCGAILTQNTAWRNVSMVLQNLHGQGLLDPQRLIGLSAVELAVHIRSAGYHNQKAKKLLLALSAAWQGQWFESPANAPTRETLLALWGVGPETADCMLLYIWGVPSFVVDAYTRRLLGRLGWSLGFEPDSCTYETIRTWFMQGLADVTDLPSGGLVKLYNEFHALIVRHATVHCLAKARCTGCPLLEHCARRGIPG